MGSENVTESPSQIGWYEKQKNSRWFIGETTPKIGILISLSPKELAEKFRPRYGPQKPKDEECSEVIQKEKSYPQLKLEDLICDVDSLALGAEINTPKNLGQSKPLGHPFNPTYQMINRSVTNLASPTRPNEYNFLDNKNFSDKSDGLGPENTKMQNSTLT